MMMLVLLLVSPVFCTWSTKVGGPKGDDSCECDVFVRHNFLSPREEGRESRCASFHEEVFTLPFTTVTF